MGSALSKDIYDHVDLRLMAQTAVGVAVVAQLYRSWRNRINVPTYGGVLSFSRLLSTIRMTLAGGDLWRGKYAKHSMILMPAAERWNLIVRNQYIEELSRAGDDVLSFIDATNEGLQVEHTLGHSTDQDNLYHVHVIRHHLTRHLGVIFPDMYDEICHAYEDEFSGSEWKEIELFTSMLPIVARASNRIFVGLPLCRNKQWLSHMIDGASSCISTAAIINLFPKILRPIVGRLLSRSKARKEYGSALAREIIEDQLKLAPEERPDDYISWLLSSAPPEEHNVDDITQRLLLSNFAAIHTSSLNVTHIIYWLLARPEYIAPLREEIESVTSRLGWTKNGISMMPKLESFMKECMRLGPLGAVTMLRKARQPFTFSNGVTLPVGATVGVHLYATHYDENNYPDALKFDGFRFIGKEGEDDNVEQKDSTSKAKASTYAITPNYLLFGYGRHACPGRFFATMEVKTMVAYLIYHYDIEWAESQSKGVEGYRPPDFWIGTSVIPNPKARVKIRERRA
ncbi:hypothetical protein FRC18_006753 [Serendipita sp. 400]|nr:hypothetical protein FRC18_006753 [Serendipita sp. 400]